MPNRWIKASILTSERFNSVSFPAQSTYVRLLVTVDDHGRFDGRPSVLLSACDPLQTFANRCLQSASKDTLGWFVSVLAELEKVDLARFWSTEKGPFLLIPRFYERPRSKSKFPDPPDNLLLEQSCTHMFADENICALSTSTATSTATATSKKSSESAKSGASANGKSVGSWNAYASAYKDRYGVEPVRNGKVNSQLAKLVDQLGSEDAPKVAAFYLSHNGGLYVSSGHCVDLLLRDCTKLRTEMITGRRITRLEVKNAEHHDALREQADRVGRILEGNKS